MSFLRNKIEYILKHNETVQFFYRKTFSFIFRVIGVFVKPDSNLVLITSFGGLGYNDNPRAIFDYLLSNEKYKKYKYVWAFKEPEKFNVAAHKIKINSLKYFITALKAQYWITNISIERGLRFKKKHTRYLSTWHGTPFKYIGNAVEGRSDYNFSDVDVFCYASDYERTIFMNDFKVKANSLILTGQPRNDVLYNFKHKKPDEIKKQLNIPINKKVILYTPTWRDSEDKGRSYLIKPPIDINYWKEKLEDKYVVIFRMHQFTTKVLSIKFDDFAIDASDYPDINDLFIISDINISDYSSALIDFSILERPVYSFVYDYEDYKEKRGLYIDFERELPIDVVRTQEELIAKIINIDYEAESLKAKKLKQMFLKAGGNATAQCVKALFENKSN